MTGLQKKFWLVTALLISQVLVSIISGLVLASTPRERRIFPGVFIGGIDVGGLSREQAIKLLGDVVNKKLNNGQVILKYQDRRWPIKYSQLGVRFDIPASVDRAIEMGQQGSSINESLAMFRARYRNLDMPLVLIMKELNVQTAMKRVSSEIAVPTKNAMINYSDGSVSLVPHTIGKSVEAALTTQRIKTAVSQLSETPVTIAVRDIKPQVNLEDLKGIKDALGIGLATFSRAENDTVNNVRLVVKWLDGLLIRPGETFSFNRSIGANITERTYRAPVVTGGHLELESDSAASRVASALYQAVIYAGLEVKERHSHNSTPDYISLGQDAAVTAGQFDLKFYNNTKKPVYIKASVSGKRIIVTIFGAKTPGQTVQVITDTSPDEGSDYSSARDVKVLRIYYNRGVQSKKELLSQDRYE